MHVAPALVVGTALDKGHVEGAVAPPYFCKAVKVTRVSADVYAVLWALYDPRSPQGPVAIG